MKRYLYLAAILAGELFAAGFAAAQDVSTEVAELKARVQALERQNAELQKTVIGRLPPIEAEPVHRFAALNANEAYIESIVEQRLAEYEAMRLADDKKKEEEEDDGYVVGSDLSMTASWHHGLELTSKHKDFRVHIGGRTQFDTGWYTVDEDVNDDPRLGNRYEDGVDFRRARLRIDGTMYEWIDWAVEYDFMQSFRTPGNPPNAITNTDRALTAPTDLWWTFKEVPHVGNIRIGNQKPAIGFEHLVSSRFLPFMERSYNQDVFYGNRYNGFQPGISFFDTYHEEWGTWNVGVYKPTDNVFAFNAWDGDAMFVGRLTKLLWYVNEGRGLLHIGGSALHQTSVRERFRFRTRDAVRSGLADTWPVPADTGTLAGDEITFLNAELVAVYGPWTFQSEYLVSEMQNASIGAAGPADITYHGGYAQIMYFLTGENDRYNRKTGAFDRVIPYENAYWLRDPCGHHCCGLGAWQIGARYNYLDLNDQGINGGILHNGTFGINWFLNPNMKVQGNYIVTHRDAPGPVGDGWIHGWGIRVAHDF